MDQFRDLLMFPLRRNKTALGFWATREGVEHLLMGEDVYIRLEGVGRRGRRKQQGGREGGGEGGRVEEMEGGRVEEREGGRVEEREGGGEGREGGGKRGREGG